MTKRRWFYIAMALALFAISLGIFYVGVHYMGWIRILIFTLATFIAQFVPRMLRAVWEDETWRI